MKDLYELLNEIDIDENEIEETPVTKEEIKYIKKSVKKQINLKRKWRKSSIAAAVCCAAIGGTLAIGVINPTYALNIPIIGDIFRYLDNQRTGIYNQYKENATQINATKESNGISITMKDAIFDGQTIYYTYEITTDKDLGENLSVLNSDIKIKNYTGGLGGRANIVKTYNNTYVGLSDTTLNYEMDQVDFNIDIFAIGYTENDDFKEIEGDWKFYIKLDAVKRLDQVVNQSTDSNGIKITIDKITKTPMSLKITYTDFVPLQFSENQMNSPSISLSIKDDLGNKYESLGYSSFGDSSGISTYIMSIGKINENASKLIFTPEIQLASGGGGMSIDENGVEQVIEWIDNPHKELLENIVFDSMEIDLN